jgi:hypothetical protein
MCGTSGGRPGFLGLAMLQNEENFPSQESKSLAIKEHQASCLAGESWR